MKRTSCFILLYGLILSASGLFYACSDEEVEFYNEKDGALNFAVPRVEYSYVRAENKGDVVLHVPVQVVGPATDYDRTVKFTVVPDSCKNVKEEDYTLAKECVVKAGELTTNLDVTVSYSEDLTDTSKVLTLQLLANEYFGVGLPASNMVDVYWTDLLVRPQQQTVWRAWWYFLGRTYSRSFHELLLVVFGEEIEKYCFWGIPANVQAEHPEIVRVPDQAFWIALNRKLREYVAAYDKDNPDKPLMHSDDAEFFSNWNKAVGSGESRAGKTIAETLDRRY